MKKSTSSLLLICLLGSAGANAQNFYLSSYDQVAEYSANGTFLNTLTTGITYPQGMALDSGGNLYVANYNFGTVWQFGPGGNLITTSFISNLNGPVGLSINNGNLFVANQNGNTVSRYDLNGNLINATFASGLNAPRGLTFNSSGDLFVANSGNGTVSEFGPTGNLINATFGSGLNSPYGLAVDSVGNLFVANYVANGYISEFGPGGNLINAHFISTGLNSPDGLAFENGNLYVVNAGNNCISEYGPGGNVINPDVSSGISFGTFMVFAVPEPSVTQLALAGFALFFIYGRYAKARHFSRYSSTHRG